MVTLKVRYVIPTLWPTVNENEITATNCDPSGISQKVLPVSDKFDAHLNNSVVLGVQWCGNVVYLNSVLSSRCDVSIVTAYTILIQLLKKGSLNLFHFLFFYFRYVFILLLQCYK